MMQIGILTTMMVKFDLENFSVPVVRGRRVMREEVIERVGLFLPWGLVCQVVPTKHHKQGFNYFPPSQLNTSFCSSLLICLDSIPFFLYEPKGWLEESDIQPKLSSISDLWMFIISLLVVKICFGTFPKIVYGTSSMILTNLLKFLFYVSRYSFNQC